ncbi:MAG: YciI family protein [Actinomycetota bacterium]
MRYIFSVIHRAEGLATGAEMEAIDAFNEKLRAEGHWIMACGIESPANAVTFDNRDHAGVRQNGPFVENSQFVSGFWIISADSDAVAHELAAEGSLCCHRMVEVRRLHG